MILSIGIGLVCFFVFYFFIKLFITAKLKVLYRSIRKGKFGDGLTDSFSLQEDVIEKAEEETKKWTEDRIEEISKLKEQEEFRREFLGNLAHELKTPVFSIQGYILTLLDGGLEDESVNRMFLERASKATDRMTAILEDLDQITKMEVNKIDLNITSFNIKKLVEETFEALELRAKDKNITLRFAKDFDPVIVAADRSKIGQVLLNLLGNSIYYGDKDGVSEVRFYKMDDIVTIEVSDTGVGIAESEISRLFERFYRVEKSRNRNEGGSGLGLAIAKHIIEAHGQTISVRSTLGVGSTFTFSLDPRKSKRA
ncbi:MAG: ATP-binding protein [Crocinitomicaceae bacterium]|nr:ATP-binding protein [Crocinitomicaceae bacterium]